MKHPIACRDLRKVRLVLFVFAWYLLFAAASAMAETPSPAGSPPQPDFAAAWQAGQFHGWRAGQGTVLEATPRGFMAARQSPVTFYSPEFRIQAQEACAIEVRLKTDRNGECSVYWGRNTDRTRFEVPRLVRYRVTGDNRFHTYVLTPRTENGWQGNIRYLSLGFAEPGAKTVIAFVGIRRAGRAAASPSAAERITWLGAGPAAPREPSLLLEDGGFEWDCQTAGLPDGWHLDDSKCPHATAGLIHKMAYEGTSCVYLQTDGRGPVSWVSEPVNLSIVGTYDIRLTYRRDGDPASTAKALASLDYFDIDGRPLGGQSFDLPSPSGRAWQRFEARFPSPGDAATCRVKLGAVGTGGRIYFDAVSVNRTRSGETWSGEWIRYPVEKGNFSSYFRKSVQVADAARLTNALLEITADDSYKLFVNGKAAGNGANWTKVNLYNIKPFLVTGNNVLAVELFNAMSAQGLLLEAKLLAPDSTIAIKSDASWKTSSTNERGWLTASFDDRHWINALSQGSPPVAPWGKIPYQSLDTRQYIRLTGIDLPETLKAGTVVRATAHFNAESKLDGDWEFFCGIGNGEHNYWERDHLSPAVPTSKWPVGKDMAVSFDIALAPYMPPGAYQLNLTVSGGERCPIRIVGGKAMGLKIDPADRLPEPARTTVTRLEGTPRACINGRPVSFTVATYETPDNHEPREDFEAFRNIGVHVYHVATNLYDYPGLDSEISRLLNADPDAYVFVKLFLYEYWSSAESPDLLWGAAHPDECCRQADGSFYEVGFKRSGRHGPSLASHEWQVMAEKNLRALLRHIECSPFGSRVAGYCLMMYEGPEWMYWGSFPDATIFCDYSRPMQTAFQNYLKVKYAGGTGGSTAATAIPTPAQRTAKRLGLFLDPVQDRSVVDYNRFFSDLNSRTLLHFAHVVKEETHGRVLAGAPYGYTFALSDLRRLRGGHTAMANCLNSKDFDFVLSPTSYAFRDVGGNAGLHGAYDSLGLHGKILFNEDDIRPFPVGLENKTIGDTVAIIKREGYANIIRGVAHEWYDFGRSWYAPERRILHTFERVKRIADLCTHLTAKPTGMAVIVDEKTSDYLTMNSKVLADFYGYQQSYFGHSGVDVKYYLLDDIENPELLNYKCLLFLADFRMDERQQAYIKNRLERDGRTLVWVYAAGFVRDSGFSVEAMSDLIGIRMKYAQVPATEVLKIRVAKPQPVLTGKLPRGFVFGQFESDDRLGLKFFADDASAVRLGEFVTGGETGFCIKRYPAWNSIYFGAPRLVPSLVKAIARFAGLNVYNDNEDDCTMANDKLVMVHSLYGGTRELRLPEKRDVYDLYEDRCVAKATNAVTLHLEPRSTSLFYTGTAEEYQRAKTKSALSENVN